MPAHRELLSQVEARGIRLTAQRRVLIEIMQETDVHLDAASLFELARRQNPNINRATVYRTIEMLKRLGMIDELDLMHLNGEKHYYEVRPRQEHLHLTCFGCGEIFEFATPTFEDLKQEIGAKNDFAIQVERLEVGGICSACTQKDKSSPAVTA